LVNICLILSLTAAIPGCGSVQPIANGIKNLSASLTAFVFSILGFAVSVQTVISAAGDSYASRTVRFASGVFIPVIGNMVGEASRTVLSAVAKAKSIIGLGGITALLTIVVPPVAVVVMYKLGILFCASSAKMLGCEKEAHLLYDINGIFGVLLAVMLGTSLVGLLAITVFVCAGAKA
jgi:stage III sporulation protein AE